MNPEAQDPIITEISATLEQIRQTNGMIAYHRQVQPTDENAVENFERLKANFLRQLETLLKELEINATFQSAA